MRLKIVLGLLSVFMTGNLSAEAEKGIDRLMQGNQRFVESMVKNPRRTEEVRLKTRAGQSPFAIILGCADSRVAPEIIFDQGIGDLFVVRVAGNVVGPLELDSINFSASVLKSSVILVLGHEGCGAVDATLRGQADGIPAVAALIEPAVKEARKQNTPNVLETAIKDNAKNMRNYLLQTPVVQKLVEDKKLEVYAGYYNKKSGKVELLD